MTTSMCGMMRDLKTGSFTPGPGELDETTGMKTIHQDMKSSNLSMNEAIDVAQNRPIWRLISAFGTMYSHWCMTGMIE